MRNSSSILLHYEAIATITSHMLEQAHSDNWDAVIELGERYSQAVESLRHLAPLSAEEKTARQSILSIILDNDARIRNLASPELARLGALLGNMKRHQTVLQAYGAHTSSTT